MQRAEIVYLGTPTNLENSVLGFLRYLGGLRSLGRNESMATEQE